MSFLSSLDISGSALTAQKFRMRIIAQNLANAHTTRAENGETSAEVTVMAAGGRF